MKKQLDKKDTQPLTKSTFHALLRKAAQPIPKEGELPSQEVSETSEHRPSDGYSAKRRSLDRIEGSGESQNG